MNKNTPLNQNYICSISADGVHQVLAESNYTMEKTESPNQLILFDYWKEIAA